MLKVAFESYLCRPFCSFFRAGEKEEMACQGALVLAELVQRGELVPEHFPAPAEKERRRWQEEDRVLERVLCQPCPFALDGCDFHSELRSPETEPCGGYLLLQLLKEQGAITNADLELTPEGRRMWREAYLRLHPQVSLKRLEQPYLYHCGEDELYELDATALNFLARCDGAHRGRELTTDAAFVTYCLDEGLLEALPRPAPAPLPITITECQTPSLRYLELQLTHRCNLRCRHCYLGPPRPEELALAAALAITREFAACGGLRLLISGGEPLLYPALQEFIEETKGLQLRRVLLTNGTLLTAATTRWLQIEEVQVSLDGWRNGHERLRGMGTFDRALRGLAALREAGIPFSIASMAHRENIDEFPRLERFTQEIGAREWGIDLLCPAGSLLDHPQFLIPADQGAPLLQRAYGGGYHGASDGFACGRHLLTVLPSGQAVKCGFYADESLGDARHGLLACWQKLQHIPTASLACRECPVLADCAGGCRFRAGAPLAPDPVMCALHGVAPPPVPLFA